MNAGRQPAEQPIQSHVLVIAASVIVTKIAQQPAITLKGLNTMGLDPRLASFLPKQLTHFCEGLRYPHAFVFLLPTFILGLLFSPYIPEAEIVLTVIGLAMFYFSKARWD